MTLFSLLSPLLRLYFTIKALTALVGQLLLNNGKDVLLSGKPIYRPGKFLYSRCSEDVFNPYSTITCEQLNITKAGRETISKWPPGPYAIFMSNGVCPEPESYGWKKSIFKIKASSEGKDWKLNFCVKINRNVTLDKGEWMTGTYRIYMSGVTCPEGFAEFKETVTYETFSHFGPVPNVSVVDDSEEKTITFYMCERNSSNISRDEADFGKADTKFLCKQFIGDEGCEGTKRRATKGALTLVSDFDMSSGTIPARVKGDDRIVWYQFDLGRTLPVAVIKIRKNPTLHKLIANKYKGCYYDNVKWKFLRQHAANCYARMTVHSYVKLRLRNGVQARFITLLFQETDSRQTLLSEHIVSILLFDLPTNDICNEDLGMEDGSIRDFQITASSWLPHYMPSAARPLSAGWCTEVADLTPWILVDLIAVTRVEGISMWTKARKQDTVLHSRTKCLLFDLFYGVDVKTLAQYNDTDFHAHARLMKDVQIFVLLNPIAARYVKLNIRNCFHSNSRCLKFELNGCKLAGIPSLDCQNKFDMFEVDREIRTEGNPVTYKNTNPSENCSSLCLQKKRCSIVSYSKEEHCTVYPPSKVGMWHTSDTFKGKWSAKLCDKEHVDLFPSLKLWNKKKLAYEIITNVEYINRDSIIRSIGYPFSYGRGQDYKWLIKFNDQRFIRIVFTNVSMRYVKEECFDRLLISKRVSTKTIGKEIYHKYNERMFVMETEESLLFLTFISCHVHLKIMNRGFRAIVTGEKTPACFTTNWSDNDWSQKRNEICQKQIMIITSMSLLNIPPLNVEEVWLIKVFQSLHYTVQLHIIDFYVVCPEVSEDIRSKFVVVELKEERIFCNTDKPLAVIHSKTASVSVKFQRHNDPETVYIRKEGFRLRYSMLDHSLWKLKDHKLWGPKVCSKAFRKCYHVKMSLKTWNQASELCRKCDQTLVTIQSEYELQFVNYLLRDHSHHSNINAESAYLPEGSFSSHIGLRHVSNRHGRKAYVWENASPVTYFPWKLGYPAAGKDCTRTNFQFISNRTLESEDCTTDISIYFVCQSPMKEGIGEEGAEACDERENIDSDIVFMIHSSRQSRSFNKMILFVQDLVRRFDIGPHATQIAAVVFSDYAKTEFYFNDIKTTDEAQNKIGKIKELVGDHAYTNLALEVMRFEIFSPSNGARYNVPQIGILLTDESSTDLPKAIKQAKLAKDTGIKLLAIGLKQENVLDYYQEYFPDYYQVYIPDYDQRNLLNYDQLDFSDYKQVNDEELKEIVSKPSWENCILSGVDELNFKLRLEMLRKISNIATSANICKNAVWKKWKETEKINITFSGAICQTWATLTPRAEYNFKARFPDFDMPYEAYNFCQDPDSSGILWCYTEGRRRHLWEPCFMQPVSSMESKFKFSSENIQKDSNDTVECGDGRRIHIFNVCDGVFHCNDVSDETSCKKEGQYLTNTKEKSLTEKPPERIERGAYFLCGSKEWISILAKCDDVIDCDDASDELTCSNRNDEFTKSVFSCDDEDCMVCDSITANKTAEEELRELRTCDSDEYKCNDKECISMEKRCNAIIDCVDGSDENQCDSCKDSFHCDEVKCIPLRLQCDKDPDCEDGTDENSCAHESFSSCDQWWEHGYHTSGNYVIDGISVYCDFTFIKGSGKITMSIRNIDIAIENDRGKVYTRSVSENFLEIKTPTFRNLIHRDGYSCFLEVKRKCQFPTAMSIIDDSTDNNMFQQCQCTIEKFKAYKLDQAPIRDNRTTTNDFIFMRQKSMHCDGTEPTRDLINEAYYNVTRDGTFYMDSRLLNREVPILITPEQIICTYDGDVPRATSYGVNISQLIRFVRACTSVEDCNNRNRVITGRLVKQCYRNEMIMCAGEHKTIPASMLCIYDVDGAGVMAGCRSGSHLQNCGNVSCPTKTVKCPGSYCIPFRFVCDGNVQCPGGEDEHECTCTNTAREVLIFVEDVSDYRHDHGSKIAAVTLAKQFYTPGSDIRLLHFRTQVLLQDFNTEHRLLEIREEQIYSFQILDQTKKCRYKSMARNLLGQIQFATNNTKSIVFIEDSFESSKVAELMFSSLSKPGFRVYRVFMDAKFTVRQDKPNTYRFVKDVPIHRWNALFSIGYKRFPEICKAATEVPCSGGYRCASSKQCIPLDQVCDGISQCHGKDDERLCDLFCPHNCTCVGYTVSCRAANLKYSDTQTLSINTRVADMSKNPGLKDVLMKSNFHFLSMTKLNLSSCEIANANKDGFFHLSNLKCLDIGYNRVKLLQDYLFSNLEHLVYLNLDGNFELQEIASTAFRGLKSLRRLRITGTKLKRVSSFTFSYLTLQSIDISYNEIIEIEDYAFNGTLVEAINFRENKILTFNSHIFEGVLLLEELQTPAYKFCCIRPCSVDESKCFPQKNEFSSCGDLMRHPVLQAVLWIVGITALLGNLGTILYRVVYDRKRLKIGYGIFVTNLAGADLLMGAYLLMIAIADSLYRNRKGLYDFTSLDGKLEADRVIGRNMTTITSILHELEQALVQVGKNIPKRSIRNYVLSMTQVCGQGISRDARILLYIYFDDKWRNSVWCVTAGILSTVSSEASVLFVCLITLDRLLVIKYPFGTKRFGPKKAYICCIMSWAVAFIVAVIPVVYTGYFENKFYSRSAVCIALPLTRDKPPGWMYSVSIFVGLNFCTFVLVAFGQLSIFLELRKATSGMKKTHISRKRDLQVSRNLIFVATTDFMCWFPIGLMGILALSGYPISGDIYAWTAVFILPLNSALNPILYTLTAIIGKQSFNPNIEEQDRRKFQREFASVILKHQGLIESVRIKSDIARLGQSVKDLLEKDEPIPTVTVTAICIQLSRYLCHLHESSIGIEQLSKDTTYVKVSKKKRHKVNIVLDSKISVSNDEKILQDNIYQLGLLLRALIAKTTSSRTEKKQ